MINKFLLNSDVPTGSALVKLVDGFTFDNRDRHLGLGQYRVFALNTARTSSRWSNHWWRRSQWPPLHAVSETSSQIASAPSPNSLASLLSPDWVRVLLISWLRRDLTFLVFLTPEQPSTRTMKLERVGHESGEALVKITEDSYRIICAPRLMLTEHHNEEAATIRRDMNEILDSTNPYSISSSSCSLFCLGVAV